MRYLLFILLFTIHCSLFTFHCISQNDFTNSRKAFNLYSEAQKYISYKKYGEAEEALKKAISKDKYFVEAYNLLGDAYIYDNKPEMAIESYKKGLELAPNKYPVVYIALGNAEFSLEKYEEARKMYSHYLQYNDLYNNFPKVKKNIANCDFAIEAMKHPVPFHPENLGAGVNSKYDEYFPCLTVDSKTMLYTRLVENTGAQDIEKYNEDFFISHYIDSAWSKCEDIGPPINTKFNEGAPCLSPDGQILIFTACESYGDYGNERNGYGSCDLFFSRRIGNSWTKPINMGTPINTKKWESQPSYSSDGKTIYFIRGNVDKKGHKSQYIYMSELGEDGKWKDPVRLNGKINSGDMQETVFIHPDNRTLYFSSDGPPGMGGMDIFISKRDENGDWGEPVNLGYPINTLRDENSFSVSGDGKTAYFASDRTGGYGGLDLYSFGLPEADRPQPVSYIKGKIFDKETKNPVYARFELIDLETGRVSVKSFSNKGNGEFLVCLPLNRNYALNVSADKYLFYSENFTFSDLRPQTSDFKPYNKDIPLQPIKVGETVILKNIFFETAKYDLKPESQIELNKLIDLLDKNPKMKIELSGHTDNVGGKDYNQALSENRAKTVYDYLAAHNISPERLAYKGFGDNKPIDTNDTETGRANNRRTEFKVVGN
jgi:outer membrane protein OmpA-like peptidoglycan-associated protein/tetratricopeptide (TPR) repeat protein